MPDDSALLGQLAEEYTAKLRAGERPPVEDYAARHPALAERIRHLFPTLLLLEGLAGGTAEPERPAALAPETTFGTYRILRELGRGGMGVVYEAEHLTLHRRVALKVLPLATLQGGQALERFFREARTAAGLHHTNIVPVFDVGQANGLPYYAMQYIQGRSLDRIIKGDASPVSPPHLGETGSYHPDVGWAPPTAPSASENNGGQCPPYTPTPDHYRLVARLGLQAAQGLAHAHQRGVIHRDIKPSNLLVDDQDTLWITDFGLARRLEDVSLTHSGQLLGTPRYMSPEQAEAAKQPLDHRTDIYSLGATLYELLVRRPAFDGQTPQEVVTQIVSREPIPPRRLDPKVPRDLETVIHKAMAKRPADRYVTAQDFADDLQRFLNLEPVKARRIGVLGKTWRWARRNPTVAGLTIVVAVLLVVVAVGGVMFGAYQHAVSGELSNALDESEKNRTAVRRAAANMAIERGLHQFERSQEFLGAAQEEEPHLLLWFAQALELAPTDDTTLQSYLRLSLTARANVRRWTFRPSYADDMPLLAAFSPDGRSILTDSRDGNIAFLLDASTGMVTAILTGHGGRIWALAFSPDGKYVATGSEDKTVRFWDAGTGKPMGKVLHHELPVQHIAFDSAGHTLLTRSNTGRNSREYSVWNIASGERQGPRLRSVNILGGPWDEHDAKLRPDGRCVLINRDKDRRFLELVDVQTGQRVGTPLQHAAAINDMAFTTDGQLIATGGDDNVVRLWDGQSGEPKGMPLEHASSVTALDFSPDSRKLVTGCADGTIYVWDISTGKRLNKTALRQTDAYHVIWKVALPGHAWFVLADADAYDLETGRPVFLRKYAAYHPQCTSVFRFDHEYEACLLQLAPVMGTPEQIKLWIQVNTRKELTPDGEIRDLDEATWEKRRQRLAELVQQSPVSPWIVKAAQDRYHWLRCEARERCQNRHVGFAEALPYLDRLLAVEPTPEHYDNRARAHAELGNFAQAAKDWSNAEPTEVNLYCLGLTQLGTGDLAGYRRTCATLYERYGKTNGDRDSLYLLAPDALPDMSLILERARKAEHDKPLNERAVLHLCKVLYRVGRYGEALQYFHEPGQTWNGDHMELDLFLAMTHHRAGDAAQARKWLAQAVEKYGKTNHSWATRLEWNILRREAEAVILGSKP